MGWFGRQLLKVIDWEDDTMNTIVYKYPMDEKTEIMMGSKLTVRESQMAIFLNKGKIADIFPPGFYKLHTDNLPVLTSLNSWKYGFNSPFKADVFFVNTRQFIDQKWGTRNPIMMRDADFGVVRLRGFGKFSYKIDNPEIFLKEIFGTSNRYKTNDLSEYLSSILLTAIADQIAESKISAIDLAASYLEFGESIKNIIQDRFKNLGLELCSFIIENISLPEEVEKALDSRSSVGIMSDKMGSFMQYQAAQSMKDAANNPGNAFAGAGIGIGAGGAFGAMMADSLRNATDAPKESSAHCVYCNAKIKKDAKFCPECGKTQASKMCPKCGANTGGSTKFCPECGTSLQEKTCAKCGHKLRAGAKFCPECGEKNN